MNNFIDLNFRSLVFRDKFTKINIFHTNELIPTYQLNIKKI